VKAFSSPPLSAMLRENSFGFRRARALEHHVFEHVRGAGQAARLVAAADLVPDLRDHHRRAVILAHNHLQAVAECLFVGCGLRSRVQRRTRHQQQGADNSFHQGNSCR